MSKGITIDHKYYEHEALLNKEFDALLLTPFEKKIIAFYQDWFGGRNQFVIKTSGSTGTPKEITFTKNDLHQSARISIEALQLQENDQLLLCLSPQYIAGMMMLVRGFVGNLNIHAITPQTNPLESIHHRIDFTALVPNQLYNIIKKEKSFAKLKKIKTVIVGGGSVNASTIEKLKGLRTGIYQTYGMTETLTHIALKKISGKPEKYYRVLKGFKIGQDERQCLAIHTPYDYKPVITNDIVEIINQREFKWVGRIDNVINSGGIKIHPEQTEPIIDRYLKSKGIFNTFFTAGIPDRELENKLVLFIEGVVELNTAKMIEELKELLPLYKSPKDVILMDKFVFTPTEKINRRKTLNKLFKDDD